MNETEERPYCIPNHGNTCFINSAIQILSHMSILHNTLLDVIEQKHVCETRMEIPLWKNWLEISGKTYSTVENQYLHPKGLLQAVQIVSKHKKNEMFCGNDQQDFLEFVLFIIESLHCCIKRTRDIKIQGTAEHDTDKLALTCYKFLRQFYKNEYSEIYELFYGIMVSNISPKNDLSVIHSSTPEMFFSLDLSLPEKNCTLYECLNFFFQKELMEKENAWYNESTKKKEDIYKYLSVFRFPKVLWISLKRFSYDGVSKITSAVEFPTTLDMSHYTCGYSPSKQIYTLYAICNHHGKLNYGHYTCIVKTHKWFLCNDDQIHEIKEDMLRKTYGHVYCLVYVKQDS